MKGIENLSAYAIYNNKIPGVKAYQDTGLISRNTNKRNKKKNKNNKASALVKEEIKQLVNNIKKSNPGNSPQKKQKAKEDVIQQNHVINQSSPSSSSSPNTSNSKKRNKKNKAKKVQEKEKAANNSISLTNSNAKEKTTKQAQQATPSKVYKEKLLIKNPHFTTNSNNSKEVNAKSTNNEVAINNNKKNNQQQQKKKNHQQSLIQRAIQKQENELMFKSLINYPIEDSVQNGKSLFEWLISPNDVPNFFSNFWEKKPLHLKRPSSPDFYSWLISSAVLDNVLRNNIIKFGKNLDITSYKDNVRETLNPEGRAMPAVVWDYYKNGCSIRFLNPQCYIKPLWNLNASLQEYVGTFVGANVYLTPPQSQGFAPHYDDIEAFILQVEGKKHWKLYKPRKDEEELPRFSSPNFSEETDNLGEPILDVILEAGDLLYFPRGTIHQGKALDEHSLHITLSCYQTNTWGDYLKEYLPLALETAMSDNIEFRKGLPKDYLSYMGVVYSNETGKDTITKRNKFITNCKKLIGQLGNVTYDFAADQMGKKFLWDSLPPKIRQKEKAATVQHDGEFLDQGEVYNRCEFDPDVKIKLIRQNCARLIIEEDSVRLYYNLENSIEYHGEEPQYLEVPVENAPIIEFIILQYPKFTKISDLPGKDEILKIQIVTDLWEKGILRTETSLTPINYDEDYGSGDDSESLSSSEEDEEFDTEDDDDDENGTSFFEAISDDEDDDEDGYFNENPFENSDDLLDEESDEEMQNMNEDSDSDISD